MAFLNNPALSSYIIVLNSGIGIPVKDIIPFQFMPNSISDSGAAVYNDTIPIARSSPVKSYSHSSARTISFALEFFASPEAGLGFITPLLIKTRIDALRALRIPDYSGMQLKPPPRCIVHIGEQIAFLGVCKSVSVTYDNTSPWDVLPVVLAHHAIVNLTFEEALNIPLSNNEVRLGLPISFSGNEFSPGIPTGNVSVASSFG